MDNTSPRILRYRYGVNILTEFQGFLRDFNIDDGDLILLFRAGTPDALLSRVAKLPNCTEVKGDSYRLARL